MQDDEAISDTCDRSGFGIQVKDSSHLISAIQSPNHFIGRTIALTDQYPNCDLSKFGFYPNWKDEPLWTILQYKV